MEPNHNYTKYHQFLDDTVLHTACSSQESLAQQLKVESRHQLGCRMVQHKVEFLRDRLVVFDSAGWLMMMMESSQQIPSEVSRSSERMDIFCNREELQRGSDRNRSKFSFDLILLRMMKQRQSESDNHSDFHLDFEKRKLSTKFYATE